MSESAFERCFPSQRANVKPLVLETLSYLRSQVPSLSEEAVCDLRLIFSELLYNAVIHGNKEDKEKTVSFSVQLKNGYVECFIADQGQGFDYKRLFSSFVGLNGELGSNLDSEHGRGVLLASSLVDLFTYNEKGNIIKFIKKVMSMVEPYV